AYLGRFPKQDFAVVVLSNYESTNPNYLSMQVAELYLKNDIPQAISNQEQEPPSYEKIKAEELQAYTGYYWDELRFTSSKIYVEKDTLRWSIEEGKGSPLGAIGNKGFQRLNSRSNLHLRFELEDKPKKMMIFVDDLAPTVCKQYVPLSYPKDELSQFTGSFYSEELHTSYTILLRNGQLLAEHPRGNDIHFTAVQKDMFSGDHSYFRNIVYIRDADNKIKGIEVSSFQARNQYFKKLK
ncbi:MAG: hypothetical protein AAF696_33110, partial [Bacteroidota bacterium]